MKKTLLRSTAINTQTTSVDFMTAKKQTTKLTSAKSSTFVLPICIILRIRKLDENRVDSDKAAHNEPPYQDLRCL